MSRESGFSVADIATNMARDEKFRRLARLHADLAAVAFAGYIGIVLESWAVGKRVAAIDGWPGIIPWCDAALEALREQNLLDKTLRIPLKTWDSWYGTAFARRDRFRQAGSIGGQKKASNAVATLQATLQQRSSDDSSDALPVPSVPPDRSVDSPKSPQVGTSAKPRRKTGDTLRAKGQNPRLLRDGSPETDAKALSSLAERTAKWNAEHPNDPIPAPPDWIKP